MFYFIFIKFILEKLVSFSIKLLPSFIGFNYRIPRNNPPLKISDFKFQNCPRIIPPLEKISKYKPILLYLYSKFFLGIIYNPSSNNPPPSQKGSFFRPEGGGIISRNTVS